ncbi:MAG TPA: acetate/propionate family kinase, partial [Chloroflexota bacterium]
VLILNAGSSSLKWVVLDAALEAIVSQGGTTWEGDEGSRHAAEVEAALDQVPRVEAIGHRVVHGGARFTKAVVVDDRVRSEVLDLASLAPLHNPAAVAGIDAARARFPAVPHVAAFDTAFHATLPEAAAVYPLPWEWTKRWDLRHFGFHGLSVEYAVRRSSTLLGHLPRRLVVCHLGAGCSVTAVAEGRSVETTMGFTPLHGVMMARRSGAVDPGMLLWLLMHQGLSAAEVDAALNERSGLLGVSGVSADMRQVLDAADNGNGRAQLAVDMFVRRVTAAIGASAATLGGLDTLIFTGGIGEHSARMRAAICAPLRFLGLSLDDAANESEPADDGSLDARIAQSESVVTVLVVAAREDLTILRHLARVLRWT